MTQTLWFVVPAAGRVPLARICLRQLRRTCDSLTEAGIDASAVVIADDANLRTARDLGFATVRRDNRFVSQKFNDGIALACDPRHNPRPVDFVVPCGSDDFVDWRIIADHLPRRDSITAFQTMSFVREDGLEMTGRFIDSLGGVGIRVYPAQVMERCGYRPADEDRKRGCDTSILTNIVRTYEQGMPRRTLRVVHERIDPRQLVDWKSPGIQLNAYKDLRRHRTLGRSDPFVELVDVFPAEALAEMAAHYRVKVPVAV